MILTQGEADVLLFNVCSASDITDSDKLFHSSDPRDSGDEHFSITFSKPAHYINFSKFLIYICLYSIFSLLIYVFRYNNVQSSRIELKISILLKPLDRLVGFVFTFSDSKYT